MIKNKKTTVQKSNETEKSAIFEGFYQALYDQVFSCYDSDSVYESNIWFIDKADEYVAYFGIADIIKMP